MGYRQLYEVFCDAPGCEAKDVVASAVALPVSSLHPTKNRNVVPDGWSKLYDTDSAELFTWCPEHGSHSASTAQRDEEPELGNEPIEGPQLAPDGSVLHHAPPTPEGEEPLPWDCPHCGQTLAGCWGAAPFYCTTCELEFEPALDGTALRERVPEAPAPTGFEDETPQQLFCEVCGKPQHETPSGPVCENGHGAAHGKVKDGIPLAALFPGYPPECTCNSAPGSRAPGPHHAQKCGRWLEEYPNLCLCNVDAPMGPEHDASECPLYRSPGYVAEKHVLGVETEGETVYALLADGRILSKAYENTQCAKVAAEQTLRIQTEPEKMISWFGWTVVEEAPHAG